LNLSSHQFLYRNKIGSSDSLLKLLKSETLTFLNLSGTSLGNEGLKCLILGLENNRILHSLSLSNNNLKGAVMKEFCQALVTTKIAELDLSSNQIEEVAGEELSFLLLGVYGYSELTKLNLAHNQLTQASAYKIFEAMIKENYLEHLSLEGNNLAGYLEVLERFLQLNRRLKSLNLSSCFLKTETFLQLCNGLGKNASLQMIFLNNNSCRDSGALAIAKALLVNSTLERIDLASNKIHSIGGVALANSLKTNNSLRSLQLSDNELKDEVGEAFFYIFGVNYSLVSLSLHLNPMSAKYPLDIKKYLDRNRVQQEKKALQRIIESRMKKVESLISPDDLRFRMSERLAEKETLEKKIGSYMRRLSGIKKEHDEKLEEMKEQVKSLKSTNQALSKTLNDLNLEFRVRVIQQSSFSEDRRVDDFEAKIAEIEKDVKSLTETRE
jgi:archaellum component FlaC